MPEMSMKAKAEIAAMFTVTVITPLQRCLELARPCGVAINAKQTIAIAVKYPMRSAAIVISSPPVWNDAGGTGEKKLCPTSQRRLRVKWNYSRPTSGQALALCTYAVPRPENYFLYVAKSLMWLAPRAGFEPATNRLTVVLAS